MSRCKSFLLLLFILMSCSVQAQDRKYVRKSITSLGVVYGYEGGARPSEPAIMERLERHTQLPRFDYNDISPEALSAFKSRAQSVAFTPQSIQTALNETIVPQITAAIKAVAEARATGNLTEEALASAAANKMKGSGLTTQDILKVLNSAYLYMPVVKSYREEVTKDRAEVEISGFILWYKITLAPDGTASATLLPKSTFLETGSGSVAQNKEKSLDLLRDAKAQALESWATSLGLSLKRVPDFELSGEILSVDGATVSARIGSREGLGLDDGYTVIENYEDSRGTVRKREIGFFRAESIANNQSNSNAVSKFYPHITGGVERGAIIKEHPRLGVDIVIRPKYYQWRLPKETTPLTRAVFDSQSPQYALREDVTAAYGVDIGALINTAKVSGVRQLFLALDFGLGFGNASFTTDAPDGIAPFILNGYLGILKKLWVRRVNFQLGASLGVDAVQLQVSSSDTPGDLESLAFVTGGIRFDAGLEFMITPDVMMAAYGSYKVGIAPIVSELRFRSSEPDEPTIVKVPFTQTNFDRISFTGYTVGFSISYALPSGGRAINILPPSPASKTIE
jgi:hypothetical protein